ncbi:hypothetical protein IAT38_003531 [Cryptococcus sp. DSM 104549]
MPNNTFATSGRDLNGTSIDNGRLEFVAVLGIGAYGVVYLARDTHQPTPVYLAVKCLLRAGLDSRQRHFQRREIALHQLASRHPNVVTLHKVIEEGDYIFVVMDFYDEGDLFGMITEKQRYLGNDFLIKKVFLQIIDSVDYCHRMGIFHRDLKPENILCTKNGEKVCIADFGLATSERFSTDFGCGSTFYLSPECQGGLFERLETYSTETTDIWSLGVILVNLTCGRNPWRQACPKDETFRAYVHNPDFLRSILPISHETNRILKGLFALEPKDRITLKDLRAMVVQVERFTMTDEELQTAHAAAREAAAAVRPVPPATVTPAPAPVPVPSLSAYCAKVQAKQVSPIMEVDDEGLDAFAFQQEYARDQARQSQLPRSPLSPQSPQTPPSPSWDSPVSSFSPQIDDDILAHLDFTLPSQSHYDSETPQLIAAGDPLFMVHTSSRSSSSGDVSLPPTPQFSAMDMDLAVDLGSAGNGVSIPRWDMGGKGKEGLMKPQRLHLNVGGLGRPGNSQSPLNGEFVL